MIPAFEETITFLWSWYMWILLNLVQNSPARLDMRIISSDSCVLSKSWLANHDLGAKLLSKHAKAIPALWHVMRTYTVILWALLISTNWLPHIPIVVCPGKCVRDICFIDLTHVKKGDQKLISAQSYYPGIIYCIHIL